jgi:hypothetical protein
MLFYYFYPFSKNKDESNVTTTEFDTQSLPDRAYFRKQSKYSTHEPERVTKLRTEEVRFMRACLWLFSSCILIQFCTSIFKK